MKGNRRQLRLFFLALCASQLIAMGLGLAVAYQVQQSYSRNIKYVRSVNEEHRAINELEIYARAAFPATLDLDDSGSSRSQISQIAYSSGIFLRKTQALLDQSERTPGSPLSRSHSDLQALIARMNSVAEQSRLAGEAWDQNNAALARARWTYADRAAEDVQSLLGSINQEMSRSKDDVLAKNSLDEMQARHLLRPLSIFGLLLIIPALLYARRLDRNIGTYETELEAERNRLEERVAARTSALRNEIAVRERLESFNNARNRLLEKVAEGKDLDEVLTQLVQAAERSVDRSQCLILLVNGHIQTAIAPGFSANLSAHIEAATQRSGLMAAWEIAGGRDAILLTESHPDAKTAFPEVWSQGFRAIFALPVTDEQQLLGTIMLLLRDQPAPDDFAREVLLSASRMASVALEHDRMQEELFHRAHYDPLTNLPTRVLFDDRLQQAVSLAARRKTQVGVLCIDLDGFKQVNDGLGHHAGDQLLYQVAQRLATYLRKTDTVARMGGDEFAAVVHDLGRGEGVAKVAESLVRFLAEPYTVAGTSVRITASIGAAVFPSDGISCAELRRHADLAMYRAKERGRNSYQMFSKELGATLAKRKLIEAHLQEALDRNGFELFYQPIFTTSRTLAGLEALIRFRSSDLKSIAPSEFIPVAEQAGMIAAIGEWVISEACRQARQWQDDGILSVPIAVNVSAIQLARPKFAERVGQILRETGLLPACLQIEITETAIMSDFEAGGRELHALAEQGIQIAIDDFGTGHSSLSYIHRLPLKTVKIDRSFVRAMIDSDESKAVVRAIVAMAQSLGLTTIAEGVESEDQLTAVVRAGCDAAQGFFFCHPLDSVAVRAILIRQPTSIPDSNYPILA